MNYVLPPEAFSATGRRLTREDALSRRMQVFHKMLFLLCVFCMQVPALMAQSSSTINYYLPASGRVSINIYDASGGLVRTLMSGQLQPAGLNTHTWYGETDKGDTIKTALTAYNWKLLQPDTIKTKYLTTLGKPFPQGTAFWQSGPGNHVGLTSVAVDDSSDIYVGAGSAENITAALKMNAAGTTRLWSAWASQNSHPESHRYQGRWSAGVSGGNYYFLQQNGWLAYHGSNSPNRLDAAVGFDPGNGNFTGTRWDALFPGTTRTLMTSAWRQPGGMNMDMAVHKGVMVISYRDNNAIRFMAPNGGTTRRERLENGVKRLVSMDSIVLRQVSIPAPKGVALDNSGNAYVISGTQVLKVSQAGVIDTVLTNLSNPYRLDINKANNEIFVVELGSFHCIKRFAATGLRTRAPLQTYGAKTREYGLYNAANFKDINDIAVDHRGFFLVTEGSAPRRLVKVNIQTPGNLTEWYGGTNWVPSASPDPQDPSTVWTNMTTEEIARMKQVPGSERYTIHSLYKFAGLGNGSIGTSFGGGYDDWHARKRGNVTYLLRRGAFQVLRVDTTNWTLKACVVAEFPSGSTPGYLWVDKDSNGVKDPGESVNNVSGTWNSNNLRRTISSPQGFDFYRYTKDWGGGKIYRHRAKWTNGYLEYSPLETDTVFARPVGQPAYYYDESPGIFAQESPNGPLFAGINSDPELGNSTWQGADHNHMHMFDAKGVHKWKVGKHAPRPNGEYGTHDAPAPGIIHNIKNTVGVTHGVVLATDANGGWRGRNYPISYAWDVDGLYVGGIFDSPSGPEPMSQYLHSFDNGAGSLYTSASGRVFYFAGFENEVRKYELTGWQNWVRLSGRVGDPANNGSYAINAGGNATGSFTADSYVTGGTVSTPTANAITVTGIVSPAPQEVYQSGRHGNFTYTFPALVTTKGYKVRLHFAETFRTAAGQRTFNVDINGVRQLTNFDVFAAAGAANKAVVREFTLLPNASGQIVIQFASVIDNAQVRGIEVQPVTVVSAVNCGGTAVGSFATDQYFTNTFTSTTTNNVSTTGVTNPAPASLYQSQRFNNTFSYTFPALVAGATYKVRMHFAELTYINAGRRVFNVDINSVRRLTGYDIFAEAGYLKATVKEFDVQANAGGQIVISFSSTVERATVCGIEISPVAGARLASAGASAPEEVLVAYPNPATDLVTLQLPKLAGQQVALQLVNARGTVFNRSERKVDANGNVQYRVKQVPAGLYYLQVQHGGGALSKKLLIQR